MKGACTRACPGATCHDPAVNPIDLIAIALLILAVILGVRSGALPQLLGLGGAAAGAIAGLAILPAASSFLDGLPPQVRAIVVLAGLLGLIGLGEGIGATIGRHASHALGTGLLGAFDRVMGALVGAAQAALILWLAGGVIAQAPGPNLAQLAQRSVALRVVDAFLPPPTEVVVQLRLALSDNGLPDLFIGLEPLPAPDVALPSSAEARAIGERAAPSVLRVVADGCPLRSSGTSFVVDRGYLVTNAHVIAGASRILVQTAGGSFEAVPVLVDLDLDLAILYARDVNAPILLFAGVEPVRGDVGATIGYPGGGDEAVKPATVAAAYDATGRDVTETARVTRRILELRARVVPGDSGSPLILADGTVGGVVFAQSKGDPTVGYALSPGPVGDLVDEAEGLTKAVPTGACIQ
jgi:S1-C subfamily serine protease